MMHSLRPIRAVARGFFAVVACCVASLPLLLTGCGGGKASGNAAVGAVQDEAQASHKTEADFPEDEADIYKGMDGGTPDVPGQHKVLELTADEIKGRNTWLTWCGGNQSFWDYFANHSYGTCDLLKVLDSRDRGHRFEKYGLMSEPGFKKAQKPDRFGLWLDERTDPPEASNPEVNGYPSGILGLRLFPNPNFLESPAAQKAWDADRYYQDSTYYENPTLVRPYRVGMACAFCHVSHHPLYPPEDPESPRWENLSSSIGAQYFKVRPIMGTLLKQDGFIYQLLDASRPGTMDTSFLATDHLNNPNAMNPLFNVGQRLARAGQAPPERMAPPAQSVTADASALGLPPDGPDAARHVPHVLIDGADSIGISGALSRVYINIGAFHQYWLTDQNLFVGGQPQRPFEIAYARENSAFWRATEKRTVNLARFFLKATRPMRLKDSPGGAAYLTADKATLDRGKIVFAENCLACHSSKQPADGVERLPADFDHWAGTDDYREWARKEVMKDDFLEDNYLSVDQRYGVDRIKTNATRALATNGTRGHIWDNFTSESFKSSPSVGTIKVYDLLTGAQKNFDMPEGGPGYYRVPSLISLWATAPYLHNNTCGKFTGDPSVKGRMAAFDDGIRKFLWPEKRENEKSIYRTDRPSALRINVVYFRELVEGVTRRKWVTLQYPWLLPLIICICGAGLSAWGARTHRQHVKIAAGAMAILAVAAFAINVFLFREHEDLVIGPIPTGTPVNLLTNINAGADKKDLIDAVLVTTAALAKISAAKLNDREAGELLKREAAPALLKVSKCPDFVLDRGHSFSRGLSDADKEALIEFLKTL